MYLYEYQAKVILSEYGVPVPPGRVVNTPEEAVNAWGELGGDVMVKAQVPVGGRGKAGAVRRVTSADQARQVAAELLATRVHGYPVRRLLVEAAVPPAQECYLAVLTDPGHAAPLVLASVTGGVEVEALTCELPDTLARLHVDVVDGLRPYHAQGLVNQAGFPPTARDAVMAVLQALYRAYNERDALLVEVNPLAVTPDGEVVALDARIIVDDNALYRQPALREWREVDATRAMAEKARIHYVPLEGDIGIIGTGAGMAMANMDQVACFGGRPANFMDVGPGMVTGGTRVALEILLTRPGLRAILVSGYSAGPLEIMARNVVDALADHPERRIPVVVRLQGHHDAEARAVLAACADPRLHVVEDFDEAARVVVELAYQQEVVG